MTLQVGEKVFAPFSICFFQSTVKLLKVTGYLPYNKTSVQHNCRPHYIEEDMGKISGQCICLPSMLPFYTPLWIVPFGFWALLSQIKDSWLAGLGSPPSCLVCAHQAAPAFWAISSESLGHKLVLRLNSQPFQPCSLENSLDLVTGEEKTNLEHNWRVQLGSVMWKLNR